MNQTQLAKAVDTFLALDSGDDSVITDVNRPRGSVRELKNYAKWKQNLRTQLIREHYQAEQRKSVTRKPILIQMLRLD